MILSVYGVFQATQSVRTSDSAGRTCKRNISALFSQASRIHRDQTRKNRGGGSGGVVGRTSARSEGTQMREGGASSNGHALNEETGRTAPALIHRIE